MQYLYRVEILTTTGYKIVAEECSYEDALRRFGHDTPLRFTRL